MANRKALYIDGGVYRQMNTTTDILEVFKVSTDGSLISNVNAVTLGGIAPTNFLRSNQADTMKGLLTISGFTGLKQDIQCDAAEADNTLIFTIKNKLGATVFSVDAEGDVVVRDLQVNGTETVVDTINTTGLTVNGPLVGNGACTLGNGNDDVTLNPGTNNLIVIAANISLTTGGALTVSGNVTGATIGGITPTNLADKSAAANITGAWVFSDINLNNLFKINGVATSANVTAANLNTLTSGANADALHTHAGPAALTRSFTAEVAIAAGKCVRVGSGNNTVNLANAGAEATAMAIGFAETAGGVGETIIVKYAGIVTGVLTGATPGQDVFVAITDGDVTTTPPSAPSFKVSYKVGRAINATDFLIEKGVPIALV